MTPILILGHRGVILPGSPLYQNSANAMTEALATSDGFETDACASRDGVVFLIHEAKYVHTETGVEYCAAEHLSPDSAARMGSRKIEEMDADEIRDLRLKSGAPIPELADILAQVKASPDKLINIELKGYNVLAPVLRTVKESGIPEHQILLSSFNHPALLEARTAVPGIRIGAIFVSTDTLPAPLFPWHPGSAGEYRPFTDNSLDDPLLRDIAPDVIVIPDNELNESAINRIAARFPAAGLIAWVFTERGETDPNHLIATAARLSRTGKLEALIVDNPRRLTQPLKDATRA